jgi:DNA repair protein SbcC/Rad50
MRLISLRLRQWRCFEDCAIDLPDGLIGVRGQNGAGKSTLAEAIGWALFGKLRHRAKVGDLRRQGAPKGAKSSVELEFQLGSSDYRVERFVGGDAKLWINGQLETQKVSDTNARIVQELDLTWDVFQRTVFAQQKDVAALDPGASADQRKSHVERLLGLERFKHAATRARSDARLRAAELAGLREKAPDLDTLATDLKEAERKAAEGDPAVAEANALLEATTKARDKARKLLESEQTKQRKFEVLRERNEAEQKRLDETLASIQELASTVGEREKQTERLAKIDPEAQKLKPSEKSLATWDSLADNLNALEDVTTELVETAFDATGAAADRKRCDELNAERMRLSDERIELAERVATAKRRVDALRHVEQSGPVDLASAALGDLERQWRDTQDQLTLARAELTHDQAHLDEVATGGPKTPCPVCKKPFGAEYEEIVEGYERRIADNTERVPKLEATCERLQTRVERARDARDDARAAARKVEETEGPLDAAEASDQLNAFEQDMRTIDARLRELTSETATLTEKCQTNEAGAARWHELTAIQKEKKKAVDKALAALGRNAYSKTAHDKARDAHDRLVSLADEAASLRDATADMNHLQRELKKQTAERDALTKKLAGTTGELTGLGFDEARLEAQKEDASKAEQAREDAQTALTDARLDAHERSSEVKALRERLAEAKSLQDAITTKTTEVRQHEVAAEILSGYRDRQARRAWPRLEQLASALLSATTDGRYADVKLSADYRLLIVDRGEDHELARFSGGEQDLANLCLRLAIADWVSKERNVDLGVVVLDEVFGSQDEERRQRLVGELRTLSNRFRQMFVITHLPDIADLCDSQVEVSVVQPGNSSVTLV